MRVLLAVMLLCYVLGIALLLFMLRRIRDHAESMDGAVKSERYRTSIWFWSDPKEIPKGSAPDLAGGAGVLCMALALGWLFLTQEIALYFASRPYGSVPISGPEYLLIGSLIANLAIAFVAADCYVLLSRRPMAIAHSMSMHHGRKKSVVARRYLLAALVIWIVCYPVRIAAVQSYGAAGEDRVAYHAPFDTEVQTFDYDTSVLSERADHVCLANAEGDMLRVDNLRGSISDDADVFAYITDAMEK